MEGLVVECLRGVDHVLTDIACELIPNWSHRINPGLTLGAVKLTNAGFRAFWPGGL